MQVLTDKLLSGQVADGDGALGRLRRDAQRVLMQHGFPHRKTENWKYTPLAALEKRAFAGQVAPREGPEPDLGDLPEPIAGVVALHDGVLDPARCRLPDGVALTGLVADDIDVSTLERNGPNDAFAWLNLARLEQGWRLGVDARIDAPLVLISTFSEGFDAAVHPRLKLELAPGAGLEVIEIQRGAGPGLNNAVVDITLGREARLTHYLQRSGVETLLIQRTHVRVAGLAAYQAFIVDGGGVLNRQDLVVDLDEAGAAGSIAGVAVLDGHDLVDYHTAIRHCVGPSSSHEDFRMLADDRANGVFNGRILIVPGADDSHSAMNTGNLLLSENARINTKPELEIHAEDVTASHGATVGQLDEAARFYLRSRGLDKRQANALLKYGFAAAALSELPESGVGAWLKARLAARMQGDPE